MKKKFDDVKLEIIQLNFRDDIFTASVEGYGSDGDNLIPIDGEGLGW